MGGQQWVFGGKFNTLPFHVVSQNSGPVLYRMCSTLLAMQARGKGLSKYKEAEMERIIVVNKGSGFRS